jgi:hypothetical protein
MDEQEAAQEWEQFMEDIGYDKQSDGSYIHFDEPGDIVQASDAEQEKQDFIAGWLATH